MSALHVIARFRRFVSLCVRARGRYLNYRLLSPDSDYAFLLDFTLAFYRGCGHFCPVLCGFGAFCFARLRLLAWFLGGCFYLCVLSGWPLRRGAEAVLCAAPIQPRGLQLSGAVGWLPALRAAPRIAFNFLLNKQVARPAKKTGSDGGNSAELQAAT